MARVLAIDYGIKRTGLAVTDELQIIASGLTTVETNELFNFLSDYFSKENVVKVIIGDPIQMNGEPSESAGLIAVFVDKFKAKYPGIEVIKVDERFTSKMALQTMIESGLNKKKRQNKALVDQIAATILLQDFLARKMF